MDQTTKTPVKLTRKQKAFADHLLANPKDSATKAIQEAYNVANRQTAAVMANENLNKPNVMLYLDAHIDKAKNRIVSLIDSDKEDIALRASDSILDRSLGKAIQRSEVTTQGVSITIDLSQAQAINEAQAPTPPQGQGD